MPTVVLRLSTLIYYIFSFRTLNWEQNTESLLNTVANKKDILEAPGFFFTINLSILATLELLPTKAKSHSSHDLNSTFYTNTSSSSAPPSSLQEAVKH